MAWKVNEVRIGLRVKSVIELRMKNKNGTAVLQLLTCDRAVAARVERCKAMRERAWAITTL